MQMKMHLFIKQTTKVPSASVVQQDVSVSLAVTPSLSLSTAVYATVAVATTVTVSPTCIYLSSPSCHCIASLYLYLFLSVNVSLFVPQHGCTCVSAVFAQLPRQSTVRRLTTYRSVHIHICICLPHVYATTSAPLSSLLAILLTSGRGGGSLSVVAAYPFYIH